MWWYGCPFFFANTWDRLAHKKINFFPWRSPPKIFPTEWPKIRDLFAFWRKRGIIDKKVERQGKGVQHLCIELNYSEKIVLGTYDHLQTRKTTFKTQKFQKSPMFDAIFVEKHPSNENRVKYGWFLKILSFESRFSCL